MAPRRTRIACFQLDAGADWRENFKRIERRVRACLSRRPNLIALPETFAWRGPSRDLPRIAREVTPKLLKAFQTWARQYRVAFLLGSVVERSGQERKCFNTSILISESGHLAARYRKIHLFDIHLPRVRQRESRHVARGQRVVTGKAAGVRMGLSVCYDLRFPELYRRLAQAGARVVFVPANFTYQTGAGHWEVLLRARAIENQVFVVAPAQVGVHPHTKIRSFGTSLIIDPWGRVMVRGGRSGDQILTADLDWGLQDRLRRAFPVLSHRRL